MQSHTKFARLSRQAMTLQHGHLLQDSGFTKLDSHHPASHDWVPTIMPRRVVSSFLYGGTVAGRLSSGRPAIQNIPRADLSTSARQFREIASKFSMEEVVSAMRAALTAVREPWPTQTNPLYLPRTYYQRLKSACLEQGSEPPSWAQPYPKLPRLSFSDLEVRCYSGLIQTEPDAMPPVRLHDSFDWSGSTLFK